MLLLELIRVPLDNIPKIAVNYAIGGRFTEYEAMMHPILKSKGSVHWSYWELRRKHGIDDSVMGEDADNKNADAYRRKGLRGEFAYSGWG